MMNQKRYFYDFSFTFTKSHYLVLKYNAFLFFDSHPSAYFTTNLRINSQHFENNCDFVIIIPRYYKKIYEKRSLLRMTEYIGFKMVNYLFCVEQRNI